jgi:hypothetical protein
MKDLSLPDLSLTHGQSLFQTTESNVEGSDAGFELRIGDSTDESTSLVFFSFLCQRHLAKGHRTFHLRDRAGERDIIAKEQDFTGGPFQDRRVAAGWRR